MALQNTESLPSGTRARLSAQFREQLILTHLPDVTRIAQRIYEGLPASISLDDLISAGVVGLISAVNRYRAGHAVKFKLYAEHRIHTAILDSLRENTSVPPQLQKRAKLIEAAISMLEHEKNHAATEEEIARQLYVSTEEYQVWLSELCELSLGTDERAELEGFFGDLVETMPEPEGTVLRNYYYEKLTLAEIARILDLPESRVGQLKSQAIIRLRSYLSRRHFSSVGGIISSVSQVFEEGDSGRDVRSLIEDPTVGILMETAAAFQDLETGRSWLFTPSPAFGDVAPVSLISTAAGREIVANELGLIEHGMF